MTKYVKFRKDISKINFPAQVVDAIQLAIDISIKASLEARAQEVQQELSNMPKTSGDSAGKKAIDSHQKELISILKAIEEERKTIEAAIVDKQSRAPDLLSRSEFIKAFSKPFPDITFLIKTLANAPDDIKQHQTAMILELLKNLSGQELQKQLANLPIHQVQDLVKNAQHAYESDHDPKLRQQAQNLAQQAIMVMIQQKCQTFMRQDHANPGEAYKAFLEDLTASIPDVGRSRILDTLNASRIDLDPNDENSPQTNIAQLLYGVKQHLGLPSNWDSPEQMAAMLPNRALYQRLRFGQKDRHTYVERRASNLENDLLTARNVFELSQFKQDKTSDNLFTGLERNFHDRCEVEAEKRYLDAQKAYANQKNNLLIEAMAPHKRGAKNGARDGDLSEHYRRLSDVKSGTSDKGNQKKAALLESDYTLYNLEKIYADRGATSENIPCPDPMIRVDEKGDFIAEFNYFTLDTAEVEKFVGSTNYKLANIDTRVANIISERGAPGVFRKTYRAKTLAALHQAIANNTKSPPATQAQQQAFQAKISAAMRQIPPKQRVPAARTSLSDLKLNDKQEIQIRGLLELKSFFDHYIEGSSETKQNEILQDINRLNLLGIFQNLEQCNYEDLNATDLDTRIGKAFEWISKKNEEDLPEACKKTYEKAGILSASSKARKKSAKELKTALAMPNNRDKIKAITKVFKAEYTSDMAKVAFPELGEAKHKIPTQLEKMATEYVRFAAVTESGQYPITEAEQAVYVNALQQIATALHRHRLQLNWSDVEFKLSHKIKSGEVHHVQIHAKNPQGKLTTVLEVPITITAPLHYSLTKPPEGDEFILSYGGSRGVIAPVPELEKTRYFTNWRNYGEGQYGTAKRGDAFDTGEGVITKEGFVADPSKPVTYPKELLADIRTRPIVSKNDPNSETEQVTLVAIAAAKREKDPSDTSKATYWTFDGKQKRIYGRGAPAPTRYKTVQSLVDGIPFKNATDSYLNQAAKNAPAFHLPMAMDSNPLQDMAKSIALSQAIVAKSAEYKALGFTHNDIKPENFLFVENPDGSFTVDYIDWATGGFERTYPSMTQRQRPLPQMFQDIFGCKPDRDLSTDQTFEDSKGRFVKQGANGKILYGINPRLEILHGPARSATLTNIAPDRVLDMHTLSKHDYMQRSNPTSMRISTLTTKLDAAEEDMDDWALTAMIFGICNRKAYFELVKGRTLNDYEVPGIIEVSGQELTVPQTGLGDFNKFFAPSENDTLHSVEDLNNPRAVMYIPSTYIEGQPFHLFRKIVNLLSNPNTEIQSLLNNSNLGIESDQHGAKPLNQTLTGLLDHVSAAIRNGKGLSKEELATVLKVAAQCDRIIQENLGHQARLNQEKALTALIETVADRVKDSDHTFLLQPSEIDDNFKNIELLCTQSNSTQATQIIEQIIQPLPEAWLKNNISSSQHAPLRPLLRLSIEHNQPHIFYALLIKIEPDEHLKALIIEQGLLTYALQQSFPISHIEKIIDSLKSAGATNDDTFNLMLQNCSPDSAQARYIHWNQDALHIAIRNNNPAQLQLILQYLPDTLNGDTTYAIKQALLFAADLQRVPLFISLLQAYNQKYPEAAITAKDILQITEPNDTTKTNPYHYLLERPSAAHEKEDPIAWQALRDLAKANDPIIKAFLTNSPYPCVIAAEHGNMSGLFKLLDMVSDTNKKLLSKEEWQQLFHQTGDTGKNLVNSILEHGGPQDLAGFIQKIGAKIGPENTTALLYSLLRNPNPNNPLQNFLNSDVSDEHKYQTLHIVLGNFADPDNEDQQKQALVLLLVNSDWLIRQAKSTDSQRQLKALFAANHLSRVYQVSLLQMLIEETHKKLEISVDTTEQQSIRSVQRFYQSELNALMPSPQHGGKPIAAIQLTTQDENEIHHQRGSLMDVIKNLMREAADRSLTIQEKERVIEELRHALKQSETQRRVLEERVQSSEARAFEANAKLSEAEQRIADAEKDIEQYKQDIKAARTAYEDAQSASKVDQTEAQKRLSALEDHLSEAQKTLAIQEASISGLESKKQTAESELADRTAELIALQETKSLLAQQLSDSQAHLATAHQTISELEGKAKFLLDRVQQIEKLYDSQAVKSQQLAEDLQAAEEKLHAAKESGKAKDKDIEDLTIARDVLRTEIEKQLRTINGLGLQLDTLRGDYDNLAREAASSKEANTALQSDLENAREALQTAALEAQQQQTQLQVQITELETVVETLKRQVTNVTTQLDEQTRAAAERQRQLSDVNAALQNAQSATVQDADTIRDLTTERDTLNQASAQQKISIEGLHAQIALLQQQKSQLD
ncbi:MAG: hypothetical protein NXI01_09765, partial [Gammaproteobacteria bacterium]|nr:hypothetical protein [Gammaproteobacteria bacterium]